MTRAPVCCVVTCLALTLVGASCRNDSAVRAPPATPPAAVAPRTAILGGSVRERRILRRVVSRSKVQHIERITLLHPRTQQRLRRPHPRPIVAVLARAASPAVAVRGAWEAVIVAGAFVDAAGTAQTRADVRITY